MKKHANNFIDLTGQRFGRLIVIREADPYIEKNGKKHIKWLCQCDCGNKTTVRRGCLMSGNTKSCGCLKRDVSIYDNIKHNLVKHPLYGVWASIIQRCTNKNRDHYKYYGGRGITICDEWRNDFKAFHDFAISHGWKEGLTIDRIDNNGNYEPDNVRFVTVRDNNLNCRFLKSNNKSGYRGVSFDKNTGKWHARITIMKKTIHLGSFRSKHIAAAAYNAKAYFYGYPLNEITI